MQRQKFDIEKSTKKVKIWLMSVLQAVEKDYPVKK